MFSIDCGLRVSKERPGGVAAHHEPAQAILHPRFCNQQAESHASLKFRGIVREHGASTHREMPCIWCYRHQVLTILSFGDCSRTGAVDQRIILQIEILEELRKKKRLWIFGRSDQQGTAGNPRRKDSGWWGWPALTMPTPPVAWLPGWSGPFESTSSSTLNQPQSTILRRVKSTFKRILQSLSFSPRSTAFHQRHGACTLRQLQDGAGTH